MFTIDEMLSKKNQRMALEHLLEKQDGCGLDGMHLSELEEYWKINEEQIIAELKNKEYQPGVSYELKGADSDLNSLDVEKALSGLEKDQVLKQYQFFVGDDIAVGNMTKSSSDLVVRPEENFSLT